MKVKTETIAGKITDPDSLWENPKEVLNLYRWALHVLDHDSRCGYADCSTEDVEQLLDWTLIDSVDSVYIDHQFQIVIYPKRNAPKSFKKELSQILERLHPYLISMIQSRVVFTHGQLVFGIS